MKVRLINLFAPFTGSKYTSGLVHIEPLGLEYVGAVTKKAGHDVEIMSPRPSEDIESFGERIAIESPDVIGIGPATYNFNQAKALAGLVKSKKKDAFVVFGGYHVTALPQEVVDPVINLAIQGEGEFAFVEILDCLENGFPFDNVRGISHLKNGNLAVNPRRERISELDKLPYPLRNKKGMSDYRCSGVHYPPKSKQHSVAQVTYSRGCPFSCSYCSSENMWGRAVIHRDADKVVDEIEHLISNFGTNLIFFSDLTFNMNRKKVVELCEALVKRDVKVSWFCGCRPEGIDAELIELMKRAGCVRIHFGIEAIDEYSLKKIDRERTYKDIEKALEITSKAGIITRAYLMIGYPWETESHLETINTNLNRLHIDDLRISFFTPFPGTAICNRQENEVMTTNWDDYTTDKPIYKLQGMEAHDIVKFRDKIFLDYYKGPDYTMRIRKKIASVPELYSSFIEFFEEIRLPLPQSREEYLDAAELNDGRS